jgi:hypothetical protein
VLAFVAPLALAAFAACTPEIGDRCVLSTDCSLRGDRLCDTSQPGGYCTVFNCRGNGCPQSACVYFQAAVQGCGFDDRSPSRTGRSFCVSYCASDQDCRDGYVCTDPRQQPWKALILDDNQTSRVCMVRPTASTGVTVTATAEVCNPASQPVPSIDAGKGRIDVDEVRDATVPDAPPPDAAADAPSDASDAGASDAPSDVIGGG